MSDSNDHKIKPVHFGPYTIGQGSFAVIAGPCSIESETQINRIAHHIYNEGAIGLRGGLFKLRTHPHDFQGLGSEGLTLIKKLKQTIPLPFISEITDPRQIELLDQDVDVYQVGSRNMHNYALLKELGKTKKPILLKRGLAGLIKEWILAAEYIIRSGNDQVILCERGIRTFETATRNTFDINAIAYIKENTPFPIIADPSHGTGKKSLVIPVALAAAAAGADGLIVEVHHSPQEALSDGPQALTEACFSKLMKQLNSLLESQNRKLLSPYGRKSLEIEKN